MGKEDWSVIYKERHRSNGEVERVWYAVGPQRRSREDAVEDVKLALIREKENQKNATI